ncbi:MAG: NUDIX hydrolase [Actinobacteria bacterium]|nr:NUDIX hydrolase [Actinomycetota bacterium]
MAEGTATRSGRFTGETNEPVDSSSIVLVRDGGAAGAPSVADGGAALVADGGAPLEVFLLERHLQSDFAGGAYVFPGGKLDDADRTLPADRWTGQDPAAWIDRLGADSVEDALGLLVAAVRETFEEAGVLLGTRAGAPVTADDLASDSFVEARRRMASRDERWDWTGWLAEEDVVLDLGALALWSWWVTPDGLHRRYDTRFFVAVVPEVQVAALAHDEVEMTASRWTTPQAALDAAAAGDVTIIYPTRKNLEALATYADVDALWRAAVAGETDTRRLLPCIVEVDGTPMIQHPDGHAPEPI